MVGSEGEEEKRKKGLYGAGRGKGGVEDCVVAF